MKEILIDFAISVGTSIATVFGYDYFMKSASSKQVEANSDKIIQMLKDYGYVTQSEEKPLEQAKTKYESKLGSAIKTSIDKARSLTSNDTKMYKTEVEGIKMYKTEEKTEEKK